MLLVTIQPSSSALWLLYCVAHIATWSIVTAHSGLGNYRESLDWFRSARFTVVNLGKISLGFLGHNDLIYLEAWHDPWRRQLQVKSLPR